MIFESEPWGDTLPLSSLRALVIFFSLLILPALLYTAGLSQIQLSLIPMLVSLIACIGTPVQLGIKKLTVKDICWVSLVYVIMMAIIALLSPYWDAFLEYKGWKVAETQEVLNEVSQSSGKVTIVLFLSVCILTPIVEEVLFRRIIYGWFRNSFPAWLAVVVTSLLFSAVHFFLKGFVSLFIMGLMFNLVFLFRKNLLASILLHAMVNSMAFILSK